MYKNLKTNLFFLFTILSVITISQNANATDVCSPDKMDYQTEAASSCPAVCAAPKYGGWSGNYSPKSDLQCGANNEQGSVCGCKDCTTVIVNYWDDATWYASANYTACGDTKQHWSAWNINHSGDSLRVQSGEPFKIGPAGSTTVYPTPNPTGDTFYITCGSEASGNPSCWAGKVGASIKEPEKQKPQTKKKPSGTPKK